MKKRIFSISIVILVSFFIFGISKAFADNALEVVEQYVQAALDADFKGLASLSCRDYGPYIDHKYAKEHIDLEVLMSIEKVIRQEDSEIDVENLKIVVARASIFGKKVAVGFLVFKTPKGWKIYVSEEEVLFEYPISSAKILNHTINFYLTNKINLKKAAELAKHVVDLNPQSAKARVRLGYIYALDGLKEKAIDEYREVLKIDRNYAEKMIPKEKLFGLWSEMLNDKDENNKIYAAEKLYEHGKKDEKIVSILMQKWWEEFQSGRDKKKAAMALVNIGGEKTLPFLIQILETVLLPPLDKHPRSMKFLLEHAVESYPGDQNTAKKLLMDRIVTVGNEMLDRDPKYFMENFTKLVKIYPQVTAATSPAALYVFTVYAYYKGDIKRAKKFASILSSQHGSAEEAKATATLLELFTPGEKIVLNRQKSGDFGWGVFTFTLEWLETTTTSTEIAISVESIQTTPKRFDKEPRTYFIYAGDWQAYGRREKKEYCEAERFYLMDGLGNRYYAKMPLFTSIPEAKGKGQPGRQKFNSQNDTIILLHGEKISDTIVFPPISQEACVITFVSPKHNGHQWEIKFENIPLRNITFKKLSHITVDKTDTRLQHEFMRVIYSEKEINDMVKKLSQQGSSLGKKGRLNEAIKVIKKAYNMDPTNPVSSYNIACYYSIQGDTDEGMKWLGKVYSLVINNDKYKDLVRWAKKDQDLENLRNHPEFKEKFPEFLK